MEWQLKRAFLTNNQTFILTPILVLFSSTPHAWGIQSPVYSRLRGTHSTCGLFVVFLDDYSCWDPYRHWTFSPSMSFSTAPTGRPTSSSVFSHTLCAVSVLCASSEGFVGRQSWEMNGQTGQSSVFSVSQYSGIWGSVAEKRELLQPSWGENMK